MRNAVATGTAGVGMTIASTFAGSLGLSMQMQRYGFVLGVVLVLVAAALWWRGRSAQIVNGAASPLPEKVTGRVIRAADYAPVVHGHTFKRCEIFGTVHFPGSDIQHSKWLLGSFVVVDGPSDLPDGTLSFIDCTFRECRFKNCTAVGTATQIESLRAVLGIWG